MLDQITTSEKCSICGATLSNDQFGIKAVCLNCTANASPQNSLGSVPLEQSESPDPDRPHWGAGVGIGAWLASVAAIIVVPLLAVGLWLVIQKVRGAPLPNFADREEVNQWVISPNILLLQLIATMVAQAITVALCWAIVTGFGSRPFWASLGRGLGGHSIWYWIVFSACVLVAIEMMSRVLLRYLPQTESPFEQMLKSSQQVRIAVALLATFTAPLAEEIVYRGVLFSALRKSLGVIAAVLLVTLTFAGVHVYEYRGAWVSMIGLTFLSLALTIVRANSKSILPCIVIHTFNNAIASLPILFGSNQ